MPCLRTNAEDFLISKVAHNHKIHPALSQVSVSVVAERLTTHDRRTLHTCCSISSQQLILEYALRKKKTLLYTLGSIPETLAETG
jgi:hypothetical protein